MSSARASTSGGRPSARWALARDVFTIVLTGVVLGLAFNALERSSHPPRGLAWIPAVQRLEDEGSVIRRAGSPEVPKSPALPQGIEPAPRRELPVAAAATIGRPNVAMAPAATRSSTAAPAVLPPARSKPSAAEDLATSTPRPRGVRTTVPVIPDLGRPLRVDLPLVTELVVAGAALVALLARQDVVRTAQCVVGVLLGWAALAKLGDIPALARDMHNFRILPMAAEHLVAIVLPWIELVAALSLILGIRSRAGEAVAMSLMVVLTAAIALAMARGLNIECGCFGTAGALKVGPAKLLENVGILTLALVGMLQAAPEGQAPKAT